MGIVMFRYNIVTLCALLLVGMTGCQTPGLMATPNLYERGYRDPFASVPVPLQSNKVDVIYATDRKPADANKNGLPYTYKRSTSLALGVARVEFGHDVPWDQVVSESKSFARSLKLAPTLVDTKEVVRLLPSNERFEVVDGKLKTQDAVIADEMAGRQQLGALLHETLQYTSEKDVYLFVHGYNNTFQDAVFTIGQLWHFLGRVGVPIAYTWPAGRGGIRGYTADRESGEFTIFHLKQFMRALASLPEVHKIHIIGHSRGTDVVMTALRELHIECRGAGKDTRNELKLGNLVLAAPDLDFEVVTQRVGAEGLMRVPEQFTVYISPDDRAIGLSSWLFDSVRRIGQLRFTDLSAYQKKQSVSLGSIEVIDARAKRVDPFGHSYFYQSPAVSSDLILILREHRAAGAANGRPLRSEGGGFWTLENDYPRLSQTDPTTDRKSE